MASAGRPTGSTRLASSRRYPWRRRASVALGCGGGRGLGSLAGSHAPHERQPGGPATPVAVRFAVEQLLPVAGTFAVDHRTAARRRAPAHGGPVLRVAVPAVP